MQARFRVGCVPYVNARPLVACFDQPNEFVEVVYDVPSKLPALLDSGEVDAILVSSIEYLRRDDLVIAADVGIMSNGPVASVRMLSKVPLEKIESLALDQSSMTSNMLAQIILAEKGVRPRLVTMEPNLTAMLAECDACVLIGDKGLEADGSGLVDVDLGAAWTEMTGEPFVWALWLTKSDRFDNTPWYERDSFALLSTVLKYGLESSGFEALHKSFDYRTRLGVILDGPSEGFYIQERQQVLETSNRFAGRRQWVIEDAVNRSGWSETQVRNYLSDNVRFAPVAKNGLERFATLLEQYKLLSSVKRAERQRPESRFIIDGVFALNPGTTVT